jgi:outer membrane protein OmpA-like peptidoglycan-associated protein
MFERNSALETAENGGWVSIADMMTGLMIVFMFIAIIYIRPLMEQNARIKEIAVAFDEGETSIYEALSKEFKEDLPIWNADLDRESLSIRFKSPEVLFEPGQSDLKIEFKTILQDFFPRYIYVLDNYSQHIQEVRIEGHTSSDWSGDVGPMEAYFNNMGLSQARTRSVLNYSLSLDEITKTSPWTLSTVTANGLSSSKVILRDGVEDRDASRRVEFKVRTDAKLQMVRVLESLE